MSWRRRFAFDQREPDHQCDNEENAADHRPTNVMRQTSFSVDVKRFEKEIFVAFRFFPNVFIFVFVNCFEKISPICHRQFSSQNNHRKISDIPFFSLDEKVRRSEASNFFFRSVSKVDQKTNFLRLLFERRNSETFSYSFSFVRSFVRQMTSCFFISSKPTKFKQRENRCSFFDIDANRWLNLFRSEPSKCAELLRRSFATNRRFFRRSTTIQD